MSWIDDLVSEHEQQFIADRAAWRAQLAMARDESARQARRHLEEHLAAMGVPLAAGRFELARRALGLVPDPDAIADWDPDPYAEWTPYSWCFVFPADGVTFRPAADMCGLADGRVLVYMYNPMAARYDFVGVARSRADLAALCWHERERLRSLPVHTDAQ